jgi:hypothetical protein
MRTPSNAAAHGVIGEIPPLGRRAEQFARILGCSQFAKMITV